MRRGPSSARPTRARPAPALLLAALLVAAGLQGCGERASPEPARRNLLLITIDTLRADALGAYGYSRPITPRIDRFAQSAFVFEHAHSSASWTLPSMVSLMTSLHPTTHRCQRDAARLSPSVETLAERLEDEGFRNGAITSHVYLTREHGLDQGFDDFDQDLVRENNAASQEQISSDKVAARARAWLTERAHEPRTGRWFLWIHFFDPHELYKPHPGISEALGSTDRDLYDGEIEFTDRYVGEVLDALDELGFARDTVVALAADHGEEFRDHGRKGHRKSLYEEVLRVPLLLRVPGAEPRRVAEPVGTIDLAPTLLELLGAAPFEVSQGCSLVPLLEGREEDLPPLFAEIRRAGKNDWQSWIEGRWKLIHDLTNERLLLFDLQTDPGEQHDLAAERPDLVTAMNARLEDTLERSRKAGSAFRAVDDLVLSPEELEQLRLLGYGDGAGGGDDQER